MIDALVYLAVFLRILLLYIIDIPVTLLLTYLAVRFILLPLLFLPLTIEEWWTGKKAE